MRDPASTEEGTASDPRGATLPVPVAGQAAASQPSLPPPAVTPGSAPFTPPDEPPAPPAAQVGTAGTEATEADEAPPLPPGKDAAAPRRTAPTEPNAEAAGETTMAATPGFVPPPFLLPALSPAPAPTGTAAPPGATGEPPSRAAAAPTVVGAPASFPVVPAGADARSPQRAAAGAGTATPLRAAPDRLRPVAAGTAGRAGEAEGGNELASRFAPGEAESRAASASAPSRAPESTPPHAVLPDPTLPAATHAATLLAAAPASTPAPTPPAEASAAARAAALPAGPSGQIGAACFQLRTEADGRQQTVIRLDPEELGRVQITVDRSEGRGARVSLAAERPETLLLLLQDRPRLEGALTAAGVAPEGRSLSFSLDAGGAGTGGAGNNAERSGQGGSGAGAGSGSHGGFGGGRDDARQEGGARRPTRWTRAGVDITA